MHNVEVKGRNLEVKWAKIRSTLPTNPRDPHVLCKPHAATASRSDHSKLELEYEGAESM